MGRIRVVTTFSQKGYETYGKHMLKTFGLCWPKDIGLYVYAEGNYPRGPDDKFQNIRWFNLDADHDRATFMATHTDPPNVTGHSYQQMPVKFSHKVFAMTSAPRDCDWLIWLDADMETVKPITHELLKSIMPDDVVGTYLGRRWWTHTETGFWAMRMNEVGEQFLDRLRLVYTSDQIMTLHHKTDCAAFDYVRQVFEGKGHKFLDLGEKHSGPDIDVLAKSILGPYLWHAKGEYRKFQKYGAVA